MFPVRTDPARFLGPTMTARRLLITAALAAWIITGAVRDWIRSLDHAHLGEIE